MRAAPLFSQTDKTDRSANFEITTINPVGPPDSPSASTAFLSLGSNQGRRHAHLQAAVTGLVERRGAAVTAVSPVYESEAHTLRPDAQNPPFLNAVVQVSTTRSPEALLRLAHDLERAEGRRREAQRWAPRSLDVDLLAYDEVVRDEEPLTLPHPRLADRRFVLRPWADIAPNFVVPAPFQEPVQVLLERCADTAEICSTDLELNPSAATAPDS
ncbi:MAG: 2-amino-4-hydroxy-6-hydroxymethyldihydropteridine diphosphokinase [Salinibacter sp.]|uniref:2-amino-4-hydroxy-6- hydroxymethyldihydropteridine diphosphokinase n=1 Tax=Salinibacter sp. TaxID=2065818 RepID=UPI0035D51463